MPHEIRPLHQQPKRAPPRQDGAYLHRPIRPRLRSVAGGPALFGSYCGGFEVTDDRIVEIWDSMPGGHARFMKDWGYMQFAWAILESAAKPSLPAPVGEAGTMPGTDGFTMACFKAADVPLGTKLYAESPVDALQLGRLRSIIADYHFALDRRENGNTAQHMAFNAICKELDMYWTQGAEAKKRTLPTDTSKDPQ